MEQMEIDFRSINTAGLSPPELEILSHFTEELPSTRNYSGKIIDLTDLIDQLYLGTRSKKQIENVLWNLWLMPLDIACLIPADHPWREILVGGLKRLHFLDHEVKSIPKVRVFPLTQKTLSHC